MEARALAFDAQPGVALSVSEGCEQAVISEMTRPAPSVAAIRRNGASVTPDIGASTTRVRQPNRSDARRIGGTEAVSEAKKTICTVNRRHEMLHRV